METNVRQTREVCVDGVPYEVVISDPGDTDGTTMYIKAWPNTQQEVRYPAIGPGMLTSATDAQVAEMVRDWVSLHSSGPDA